METLISLIKRFEGCFLRAYQDSVGVWTAGWGSTGPDVKPGVSWTQEQADFRMAKDAELFYNGSKMLIPTLQGSSLSAVSDFAYNLGLTRLKASTLRRKILKGDKVGASNEFKKWVRAGGRVLPGLVMRREIEKRLFLEN